MDLVDVVVVSHNSRATLRACIEPLCGQPGIEVVVVDNASSDGSTDTVGDLPALLIRRSVNAGFAAGCNAGWQAGAAPYVLLLNPDARIEPNAVRALAGLLQDDPTAGAVAPRISGEGGSLDFSLRRHARLRSTFARALFLHRLFPRSSWADDVVRDPDRYVDAGVAEWVSGACVLVRRSLLEEIGGLDERFFLYCEDDDLCRRVWGAGYSVRYEPRVTCIHEGGVSAPRARLLPVLAASRIQYARKHRSRTGAVLERIGIALGALVRLPLPTGGSVRVGQARSLGVAMARDPRAAALAASGLANVEPSPAGPSAAPPVDVSTPS
jgi:N-acetylglucosaminyl-diphospho-decaprenol L-rhamnosyltransferase